LRINTSKANLARFLGSIRPHRLLGKFTGERFGAFQAPEAVRLASRSRCGVQTVCAVQTSTRTFIAEGLASHNCTIIDGFDYTLAVPELTHATWGMHQRSTEAFWRACGDEAYAPLLNTGVNVPGLNLSALHVELGNLGALVP
jgi:hypothetical protein